MNYKLYTLDNKFIKKVSFVPSGFTGIVEYLDGSKRWYLNGKFHRIDGPAIERSNGTKEWWINDKLHRLDGPAIECSSGSKCWYINGEVVSKEQHKLLVDIMKLKGLM